MKWTKEAKQQLIELYNSDLSLEEIGKQLGTSAKAVSMVLSSLRKEGLVQSRNQEWTGEDIEELKYLVSLNLTSKEIQETIKKPRTLRAIDSALSKLKVSRIVQKEAREWSDEELLALVKEYVTQPKYIQASTGNAKLPGIKVITERFGGWIQAKEIAGVETGQLGGLIKDQPTTFYVVKFIEEDFIKIGVTQRSIKERLNRYPKYQILHEEVLPYSKALNKELSYKKRLFNQRYTPTNPTFKVLGGWSECYKLSPT